jgi:SAM-dependent methyltransferase
VNGSTSSTDLARNRALWTWLNHLYTDAAARGMWQRDGVRWGLFGIRDRWLPPLPGTRVVELGAGTAFLSAALARAGARPIAIDLNEDQLGTARALQRGGPEFPLVQADAQAVPLGDGCADLVVSEHGASVWCDPHQWIAEAARLLVPGGWLVFLVNSPLSTLCVPEEGTASTTLQRPHAALGRMEFDGVEFHPSHGEWIEVLCRHGFMVRALSELTAPARALDHEFYEIADADWARRWPAEDLWVARKDGLGSMP